MMGSYATENLDTFLMLTRNATEWKKFNHSSGIEKKKIVHA